MAAVTLHPAARCALSSALLQWHHEGLSSLQTFTPAVQTAEPWKASGVTVWGKSIFVQVGQPRQDSFKKEQDRKEDGSPKLSEEEVVTSRNLQKNQEQRARILCC